MFFPVAQVIAQSPGADPKINERFYNPAPGEWLTRFEGESREIYARRHDIVATSGVKAGMTVADVGAGSGFMAMLFARQVGPSGKVIGYTLAQASLFFILVTLGQFFGVMLGWLVGEKFAKRNVAATCMLMHSLGVLGLTYAVNPWMLGLSMLLHGIAWGLRGPFMQAIRADYFGRESIGVILGLSTLITVFGNIGGPVFAGACVAAAPPQADSNNPSTVMNENNVTNFFMALLLDNE